MRDKYGSLIIISCISACLTFAIIFFILALMHTAVFTCKIKTTQIFSSVMGDKKIISEGSLYFQQFLNGGIGYYDGLVKYSNATLEKIEPVSITFETEYRRVGKVLSLKTMFLSGENSNIMSETDYSNLIPPYLKKNAINHITLGHSGYFGFSIGNAISPSFICN